MPTKDIEKQRKYWRDYYHRSPEAQRIRRKLKRKQAREKFEELKAQYSCLKCGENAPACLDFHHRAGSEKDTNISDAVLREWSESRFLSELAKCVPLCANCHRKLHAGRFAL
jgi:hypothetical protein